MITSDTFLQEAFSTITNHGRKKQTTHLWNLKKRDRHRKTLTRNQKPTNQTISDQTRTIKSQP